MTLVPFLGVSQYGFNKFIEIHTNLGYSNDNAPVGQYLAPALPENILIQEKSFVFARSAGISLGYYLTKNFGIKASIGQLQFGFDFKGETLLTQTDVASTFKVTYVDLAFGLLFRKAITENTKLISSLEYRINTDESPKSAVINLSTENATSVSFYTGLEYPMYGNRFFANLGFFGSYPLKTYNRPREFGNKYLPYFLGLRIGINFQF